MPINMTITVNGNEIHTTPRFWKWMKQCQVYRAGMPTFQRPCTFNTTNDSIIVAMHLLTYASIKYAADYHPRSVGALNGYVFGSINYVIDGDEIYMIYQSARTGEKEQVSLKQLSTGSHVYSVIKMMELTHKVSEPTIVKDDPVIVKDDPQITLDRFVAACESVPMGTPLD
jgi:hypothetical protein